MPGCYRQISISVPCATTFFTYSNYFKRNVIYFDIFANGFFFFKEGIVNIFPKNNCFTGFVYIDLIDKTALNNFERFNSFEVGVACNCCVITVFVAIRKNVSVNIITPRCIFDVGKFFDNVIIGIGKTDWDALLLILCKGYLFRHSTTTWHFEHFG